MADRSIFQAGFSPPLRAEPRAQHRVGINKASRMGVFATGVVRCVWIDAKRVG